MFKQLKLVIISTYLLCLPLLAQATLVQAKLFDLRLVPHHDDAAYWAMPQGSKPRETLISDTAQTKHYEKFKTNFFAPWSADIVQNQIAKESYPKVLASIVRAYRNEIDNADNKPIIQTNFRPFDHAWLDKIVSNADYPQFDKLQYEPNNRAIVTHNTFVRVFPTHDTYYRAYHSGRINPFDRLQMSVAWAGTPVYILGKTRDGAWYYIYTQSYSGWAQAKDIAYVDDDFIAAWQNEDTQLYGLLKNNVSLLQANNQRFITQAGIGAIFPGKEIDGKIYLDVPNADKCRQANIVQAVLPESETPLAMAMPIPATRENFAAVIQDMVSRPYAWGGGCYFSDCSLELKNIYTPFGIWLARHSKTQTEGVRREKLDDMNNLKQRLDYLREHGKPFMTLVYIGGHIMLYVGEDEHNSPVLYQNMWQKHGNGRNYEQYIVGQSIFMPAEVKRSGTFSMLDPEITRYYWLAHLDEPS